MTTTDTLPKNSGLCFEDLTRNRVVLRLDPRVVDKDLWKLLRAMEYRHKGMYKGRHVFETPIGVASAWITGRQMEALCRDIPGLLYVTPEPNDYRKDRLPYVAVKSAGTYTIYTNNC